MSLYQELKRRNVFRVAIAYLALAWLLTEVSGTLFPAFGIPDWGVRFVVIVFALGFVPALIISWVYELTPEGIKREKDVVRDASVTYLTAKRLDVFTIGLIVVALAFILADRMWLSSRFAEQVVAPAEVVTDTVQTPEPEHQYPPNSIAVLPFVNMSDDAGNEYFSDGISEELLNLLSRIPELRVISRSSAFAFKGEKADIPTVAKKLNVAHILEGSVRKAGNQVRITAQLIEAQSDTQLWSETYDRELTVENLFSIQSDVATSIAVALDVRLSPLGREALNSAYTDSLKAYNLFLQAIHLQDRFTEESLWKSVELLEEAIAIDPAFGRAYAALGNSYVWLGHGFANIRPVEVYRLAQAAAKRALELDPNSADAHLLLGHLAWEVDWDPEAAEQNLRRAIELGPSSAQAHNVLAWFLVQQGLFQEAKEKFATAYALDPLSSRMSRDLAGPFRVAGEFDQAIAQYRRTLRSHPDDWLAYLRMGKTYFAQGKSKNAVDALEKAVALNPGSTRARASLGYASAMAGNQEYARALLAELIAEAESSYVWPLAPAMLYAGLGEDDKALEWLETAFEDRVSQLVWLAEYPEFDSLREYPRYKAIIERINPVN